jgi:DNA-binding beta-propeller fold protein YncE
MKSLFFKFFCLLFLFSTFLFSQSLNYKIAGSINIGGEGHWDYTAVDAPMHRLYVSHNDRVHVIDLNTNKIIGEITHLSHVHGIAFADKYNKGFISNGHSDSVTVFDLKTFRTIENVAVTGKDPDAIVYDPFTGRIFTMNGHSSNTTAIDAKTDKVVGTLTLDGGPEFAVSNGKGLMYVNLEDQSEIEEFNPKTLKKIATWSIAPGEGPSGLAMDIKNNILFSGCHNKMMMIVNAKTRKVITHVPIGGHVDACRYDPDTHLAFSSNGEGNLTLVKEITPKKFMELENIPTEPGLRTMALDPATHNVYLIGMLNGSDNAKSFGVLILKRK